MQQQNQSSDLNNTLITNETFSSGSKTLEWKVRLSIDIVISITSIIGNALVLFVLHNRKKAHKTPFEVLVACLSTSDLLSICMYMTFSYIVKLTTNFTCKFGESFFTNLIMLSMFLMTAIAVFRCRSILHPFKPRPSIKFTCCTAAGLWILANVFISPTYVVMTFDSNMGYCIEIWPSQTFNKLYTLVLFVVQYVIPLTVIAVSYTKIIFYLKHHKLPTIDSTKAKTTQLILKRKRDIEVIKISVTIVVLYTVFTLPGQIAWISQVVFQNYELSMIIFKFSIHVFLLQNCCNPFVYGTMSREFRLQFAKAVSSIINCIFKRNSARTVAVQGRGNLGKTNESFEELNINTVVLTGAVQWENH